MKTDILIIGAGPAGSTFARECAKLDYRIMLVDGQTETNAKPCGGLLSPDAQRLFAEFDHTLPGQILADPQIFSVRVIDLEKQKDRFYRRCYYNMNRFEFDKYLLPLVPSNVEIVKGRVTEIVHNEKDAFTVKLVSNGQETQVDCTYLVGADGASSIVRRRFFPNQIIKHYVAIQEWYRINEDANPFYSCIFDPETSDSCSWTLFKNGYLIYGGAFESRKCRESFEKQKKKLESYLNIEFGKPVKTEACMVNSPRHYKDFKTGKDNIFLLGEAAGFISSSSFEGISGAIKSGLLLSKAFKTDHPSKTYPKLCRKLRFKFWLKTKKRIVTHTPWIRHLIMKSGVSSIK